jgi:DNA-binding PadR family transcriptional regulator
MRDVLPHWERAFARETPWPKTPATSSRALWALSYSTQLAAGERHGFGIARWIERMSGDVLVIEEGSLYPVTAVLRADPAVAAIQAT